MSPWRTLLAAAALLVPGAAGQRQFPPRDNGFPPDIWDNTSVDVARIARGSYSVEFENARVRVLHARIPAQTRVPTHRHNTGLLVAISAVRLQFSRPDGSVFQITLAPGEVRWMEGEIHAELNFGAAAAEFLFVETKNGA